ncbi:MAG TPA: DUF2007 domain-containing protein [Thermoanaerobaculia bacterium]|jgi:hypothetical protein
MSDPTRPDIHENVNTVPAENGTTWVEIASTGAEDEATLLSGFLEAAGISAQVENVKFAMEPITFGTMGDIRVYVPAEDEQRAMELLRSRDVQAEQLDDDGETLVTDDGPAVVDEMSQTENDDGATNS